MTNHFKKLKKANNYARSPRKWHIKLPVGVEDYPAGAADFYHACHFGEQTEYCGWAKRLAGPEISLAGCFACGFMAGFCEALMVFALVFALVFTWGFMLCVPCVTSL